MRDCGHRWGKGLAAAAIRVESVGGDEHQWVGGDGHQWVGGDGQRFVGSRRSRTPSSRSDWHELLHQLDYFLLLLLDLDEEGVCILARLG